METTTRYDTSPPSVIRKNYADCLGKIAHWESKPDDYSEDRTGHYRVWRYEALHNLNSSRRAYEQHWPCLKDGTCDPE